MNGLDLFSGIGGISLALRDWIKPLAYCEIDTYCQKVLLSRMADEFLRNSPIWNDIKTLDGNIFKGAVDIIYGGFPCQGISVAGHGKGLEDERSGLFFEIVRLAKEIKPTYIFLENVPAISSRGGLRVVREINEMGYACRWCTISAASVGALHKRERWFLLAYTPSEKSNGYAERAEPEHSLPSLCCDDGYAYRKSSRKANKISKPEQVEGGTRRGFTGKYWPFESRKHWQETVSGVCRTSDGVSCQVDRLRALGNAVVPQQCREAFKILMGIHER